MVHLGDGMRVTVRVGESPVTGAGVPDVVPGTGVPGLGWAAVVVVQHGQCVQQGQAHEGTPSPVREGYRSLEQSAIPDQKRHGSGREGVQACWTTTRTLLDGMEDQIDHGNMCSSLGSAMP